MIHPSAILDDPSCIGEGTRVWHFTHVMADCHIGRNCTIGQGCFVAGGAWIGDNVRIQNNVSVYEGVIIEDDAFIGPSVVFTNVKLPKPGIKSLYQKTRVGKGAMIGANSTIICGVVIGQYAVIGAGSVVTRDVPEGATVIGYAAR